MIINYSDQEVIKGEKSIFLAGPTPRGENISSWRTDAREILKQLGFDGVVYVPEYSTWKPKEDYVDQAMWERIALTNAFGYLENCRIWPLLPLMLNLVIGYIVVKLFMGVLMMPLKLNILIGCIN